MLENKWICSLTVNVACPNYGPTFFITIGWFQTAGKQPCAALTAFIALTDLLTAASYFQYLSCETPRVVRTSSLVQISVQYKPKNEIGVTSDLIWNLIETLLPDTERWQWRCDSNPWRRQNSVETFWIHFIGSLTSLPISLHLFVPGRHGGGESLDFKLRHSLPLFRAGVDAQFQCKLIIQIN